jgi:hypothetical protein
MMRRATSFDRHDRAILGVIILWIVVTAPLLAWGLPTRAYDRLLFGAGGAWSADQYAATAALAARRTRNAGADTDLNPIADRDRLVDLTPDHAARAEILRRYRLFSRQPDEMIIFQSLQQMNPRRLDFDPRLYQYGGGYLYLIAGLLVAGDLVGVINVTGDLAVYLQDPAQFARFYIVARCISLGCGALALLAIARLARRAAGRRAAWLALGLTIFSPVFITAVLEAKPHLPAAALLLWACLRALDYVNHGRRRDALIMGALVGAAFGFVLTGIVGVALWPAALLARPKPTRAAALKHLLLAGLVAAFVYAILNPYVLYNAVFNPAALSSNLGNSTAMYTEQVRQLGAGLTRSLELLIAGGGSIVVTIVGVIGLVLLLCRHTARTAVVLAVGLAMLAVCTLTGANKPAEFARFLILPLMLLIIAASALPRLAVPRRWTNLVTLVLVVAVTATTDAPAYLNAYIAEVRQAPATRSAAARYIDEAIPLDTPIGLLQEPAPYAVPPLDFAARDLTLVPPVAPPDLEHDKLPPFLIYTADTERTHAAAWWREHYALATSFPRTYEALAPLTWANKPVFILHRTPPASR